MRRVLFIHRFGPEMASYRYRCQIPADYLNKHGFKASINHGEAEIAVFAKPVPDDVRLAKELKSKGVDIIFDVTDPHFDKPEYREMVDLADYVTVPTFETYGHKEFRGIASSVIPDPYEYEELAPHADGDRLLWFGHKLNLPDIEPYKALPNLRIVTGPSPEYTPEVLTESLERANIVLLPTRKGSEYKSANRLINSLRMGLFPVCDKHPAYTEFRSFCWVNDIKTGLRFAKQEQKYLNEMVSAGQEYIEKFSPDSIGKQWAQLLDSI